MHQRVHNMMQQRQQTEIPHPQAYMPPPPSPIRVGGQQAHVQPMQSHIHDAGQSQPHMQQESHWPPHPQQQYQQQQQPQQHPQHLSNQQHPQYFSHQQQQQQQYQQPVPNNNIRPPSGPFIPVSNHLPVLDQNGISINKNEETPAESEPSAPRNIQRQQMLCMTPNGVNHITMPTAGSKITAARVLNIAFPLVDYNVDENTCMFEFSTNRLDAKAQHWQKAALPLGHFTSRYKLLDALTDTLNTVCVAGHFLSHLNRYGTNVCSIEAIFTEEHQAEHDGLFFNIIHNPRLFAMFGLDIIKPATDSYLAHQTNWTSTTMVPQQDVYDDGDRESVEFDTAKEKTRKLQKIQFRHYQVQGQHPMNLLPPTHIKLQIPELNHWYNYLGINKVRHGEYKYFEFIDDDGVVDLSHSELGGCTDLTTITPTLSTCHRTQHGQIYERPYNCRNMPIMLTIEFMIQES